MKNKIELPLKATKKIGIRYKKLFDEIEKIVSDEKCLPDIFVDKIAEKVHEADFETNVNMMIKVCSTGVWRTNKSIFSFDKELADELIGSYDINDSIPFEVFSHIPYPAVYVENSLKSFFAVFENKPLSRLMLYFPQQSDIECVSVPLNNGAANLSDAFDNDAKGLYNKLFSANLISEQQIGNLNREMEKCREGYIKACVSAVPLLMYICAVNADISVDEEQAAIYQKPVGTPKDRQREVRKYNVGYRVGKLIRQHKSSQNPPANPPAAVKGSKKSAHVRKGHYHHYWTGKRDGERTLILKWLAPSFINFDNSDNVIPTIHIIEEDKQ